MKQFIPLIAFVFIYPIAGFSHPYQDTLQHQGFLYSKFIKGNVLLKGGSVQEYLFNYNTNTREISFLKDGQALILTNYTDIDTIYLDGKKFIAVNEKFYYLATNSIYPLLVSYTNIHKPLTATAGHNGTSDLATGQSSSMLTAAYTNANFKWKYDLEFIKEYWIKSGNNLYKANNEKQFIKIFPAKENGIKDFIKNNNTNFSKEEDVIKLGVFCLSGK